jgi:anti-sigma regulatory factor (Ser/Thr protein kinase)|tara:strand:+ start:37 stop:450 length:414 start_codon:yes stop_codon:yes gene_type:complete
MDFSEQKDFEINTTSLREIRTFSRNIFDRSKDLSSKKDDLVLAIAEAAQNIVKHAYNGGPHTDKMRVRISLNNNDLQIDIFDKGKPAIPENIKPRALDDIKPGGLGTFFIGQIMDQVVFKTKKEEGWVNHLVLTKKI